MSGLVIALSPGEKFIVNGALLENGEKHARIRIKDSDARVLRCADALHPDDVNSPVKRVYYAIQLLITGDLKEEETLPALYLECDALAHVFANISPQLMPTVRDMIENKRFYSALCFLKQVIIVETNLLSLNNDLEKPIARVA
jgi:flagellar protein FlbT